MALLGLLAAVALAGCETTMDKSARLEKESEGAAEGPKGLVVRKQSKDVRVDGTSVIQDENGTAAVVELHNVSRRALSGVPIALDVAGADGTSLYRNDTGGLEESLVGASLLGPGERLAWVNDQVTAAAEPAKVVAKVGAQAKPVGGALPELRISRARLEDDPTSGTAAVGRVTNRSDIPQLKLVVYAVARRGGRVVAAGRAQIPRLKPGGRARFAVFFIGDPRGGKLTLAAPATAAR